MDDKRPNTKIGRPAAVPGEKHTREKIFNAAIDLFAKEGYDRTSVRQIAESVGLTESAIYRHYPGKEAILEAIFAYAESRIYTPLPVEGNLDGQDRGGRNEAGHENVSIFRGLLAPLPEIISADPGVVKIVRIMYSEIHHNAKIRLYFRKEYVDRADDYLEELFRQCMEKGAIRACDPRALAQVFNAFRAEWAFKTYIVDHEETIDIDALKKNLETTILFFEQLLVPEQEKGGDR
jgi:AcrR family transcriptional regulator